MCVMRFFNQELQLVKWYLSSANEEIRCNVWNTRIMMAVRHTGESYR